MTRLRLWLAVLGLAASLPAAGGGVENVEKYEDVRGSIVFRTYCMLCHGPHADGKGRAARNYNPPPANLIVSAASDAYKEMIIRKGGEAMGRSPFMPPWGNELTDEQIKDVVAYLRLINTNNGVPNN